MPTVRELPQQIGTTGPRSLLLCRACGGEYSANRGDYFTAPLSHVMECCGEPMSLVYKSTVYRKSPIA